MLMSNTSNNKNKCYITAKQNNVLIGTITASLDNYNLVYQIEITPEYENTGVTYFLINAMTKELQFKNPTLNLTTLKITQSNFSDQL